jgi:nicotinamide mononucleotide adenylyltransferase
VSFFSTPGQRQLLEQLLRKAELDRKTITLMHKPAMQKAGIWADAYIGQPVDPMLNRLSKGQASSYIQALEAQVEQL